MPKFLVTYHGSDAPPDPEAMASVREAFMQWAASKGPALVDPGAPVAGAQTVSQSGTASGRAEGAFNGWSIIEAPDAAAAAKQLEDHPFISRGGVLQVSEPVTF